MHGKRYGKRNSKGRGRVSGRNKKRKKDQRGLTWIVWGRQVNRGDTRKKIN